MNNGRNINQYDIVLDTENLLGITVRVAADQKECYEIVCEHDMTCARLKLGKHYSGEERHPTAGDYVWIQYIPNGDSRIFSTLPRRSFFRKGAWARCKGIVFCANFDCVFIMKSLNMNLPPRRLERNLTISVQSSATPVIIITKADLVEDPLDYIARVDAVAQGANIHTVSTRMRYGLERLKACQQPGKTAV